MKLIYLDILDSRVVVQHADWRTLLEHAWRRYLMQRYLFTAIEAATLRPVIDPFLK